jgi:hypothetical protein
MLDRIVGLPCGEDSTSLVDHGVLRKVCMQHDNLPFMLHEL